MAAETRSANRTAEGKVRDGETPLPARETRALPGTVLTPRLFAHPINLLYPGTDQMHFSAALMNPGSFFAELKRRNVYKVAVAYAVVGWLLIQIATQIFPFLEIPNWAIRLVIMLVAIGFPIALILAWAFELTPEGMKRTEAADDICRTKRSD